jgi:hypothetical protein
VTVRHQFGEGGVGQTSTGRSSLLTRRWREMDSNFRFRAKGATDLSFRFCLCP